MIDDDYDYEYEYDSKNRQPWMDTGYRKHGANETFGFNNEYEGEYAYEYEAYI